MDSVRTSKIIFAVLDRRLTYLQRLVLFSIIIVSICDSEQLAYRTH